MILEISFKKKTIERFDVEFKTVNMRDSNNAT
jgi:hypothetical protein